MLKDNLKKALASLGLEQVADGDYAKTGYHLEVKAEPTQMVEVAQSMLDAGCYLESFTAVDFPEAFDLVYHFANFDELCRTAVHVSLGKKKGMYTISQVYPGLTGMNGRSSTSSASISSITPTSSGSCCRRMPIFIPY